MFGDAHGDLQAQAMPDSATGRRARRPSISPPSVNRTQANRTSKALAWDLRARQLLGLRGPVDRGVSATPISVPIDAGVAPDRGGARTAVDRLCSPTTTVRRSRIRAFYDEQAGDVLTPRRCLDQHG